ncbi:MAG: BON domain-containing protein, partial [Hyphomicrobiaceae bacterium]
MRCNPLRWLWGLIPLAMLGFVAYLTLPKAIESELTERANAALAAARITWAAAAFSGRDALLTGRAADDGQRRRAVQVISGVPGVHQVVNQTTALELVRNYVWSASLNKSQLRLDGYVPNETARKAILGTAKATFPGVRVDDRTKLARGAPDQGRWLAAVTFALKQLSALNNGARVDLEGLSLTVAGEAQSPPDYKRISLDLENALPSGLRLKQNRVRAPVVKPYTWAMRRRGRQVEFSGHAPSGSALKQLLDAARQAFPGLAVVDHTGVGRGEPQGWQAAALWAVARVAQLKNGQAEMEDQHLRVTGYADTTAEVDRIRQALKKGLPPGFAVEDRIEQEPEARAREAAMRQQAERRAAEEARQ